MLINLEKTWQKVLAAVTALAAGGSMLIAYIARDSNYWAIELIARHHAHLIVPLFPLGILIFFAVSTQPKLLKPNATNTGTIVAYELARGNLTRAATVMGSHVFSALAVGVLVCSLLFSGFVIAREYKYMTVDILRKSVSEELRDLVGEEKFLAAYRLLKTYNAQFDTSHGFLDMEERLEARHARAQLLEGVVLRAKREHRRATALLTAHSILSLWPESSLGTSVYSEFVKGALRDSPRYEELISLCGVNNFPEVAEYVSINPDIVLDVPSKENNARTRGELGQEICGSRSNDYLFFEDFWKPKKAVSRSIENG
ncbi:hypothetical protein [Phaeobacter piscinae]|uniref:hypothetical protein n=1 Tax=Phaeobacter piscinae TaxID=1580596 RepID=UPI000C9CE461|nr:hypothetical protein [Phaeobacter piscinae]AUQ75746.1 hypothetical protein PhaeoP71_02905 [Phaeobacter piscinae]